MDKAIFYTAFARLFQGVGGVISVLLVASFLTGVEQGFYYTFASILAIQVFFELGLGSIITQFVAHEKAHLTQESDTLVGEQKYRSRLAYLLKFCVKWYSILSVALLVLLTLIGIVFFTYFNKAEVAVHWQIPWVLLVVGTSLNFILAPISAYLEGLGKVKEIAYIRLWQQVLSQVLVWSGLILGAKLYVVFFAPFVTFVIFGVYSWHKFGKLLSHIYRTKISERVSYKHEIFPLQWKIALSWVSGYFIFQLFNPVLFATEGAVVAGQMGMTLSILNAIMSLSDSWITTKTPSMSGYIATKDYTALDKMFYIIQRQSIVIVSACLLIFICGVWALDSFYIEISGKRLASRFLPYIPLMVMACTILMRQFQSGWSVYLRCHKQEPLMWISIIMSVACMLSTLILGNYFGVYGMTIGYALLTLMATIAIYIIFKDKQKQWHQC